MIDLTRERFYGAKSEAIDAVEVAASLELDGFSWQILHVTHGDVTDSYQVLVAPGAERDALATEEGATAYVRGAAELGEVHGKIGGTSARPMGAEPVSYTHLTLPTKRIV